MFWETQLLVQVKEWIVRHRFFPFLAIVLFALLIGLVGRLGGLTNDDIVVTVASILILAVGAWGVTNLNPSERLKSFVSWALTLVFVCIAIGVGYGVIQRLVFPPIRDVRVPFGKETIAVSKGSPSTMLMPDNLPLSPSRSERQLAAQNKFWEWVIDGLEWTPPNDEGVIEKDPTEGTVVLKSKVEFGKNFETIEGNIELDQHIKVEDAVAFLVSVKDNRYVYRQMSCRPDISSSSNSVPFTLSYPAPDEKLLMILRIRSRDNSPLPSNPNRYGISLEVKP